MRSSSASSSASEKELLDLIFDGRRLSKGLNEELGREESGREEFDREEFSRGGFGRELNEEDVIEESGEGEFDLSKPRALSSNTDIRLLDGAAGGG